MEVDWSVAIVPAAGASRRMGWPKLLLPFGGGTVVGGVVAALCGGGVGEVVVVAAPADAELAAWVRGQALTLAVNPHPEEGMLSTIRAGLDALGGTAALAGDERPVLVTPADLPSLSAATVRAVLGAITAGALLVVPVYRGHRGHPLGIAPPLLSEIDRLDPKIGLRDLLARYSSALHEIRVQDAGTVHDIDTPADYTRLRAKLGEVG